MASSGSATWSASTCASRAAGASSVSKARGRSVTTLGDELIENSAIALPPKTGLVMTSSPPSTRSAVASVTMPLSRR